MAGSIVDGRMPLPRIDEFPASTQVGGAEARPGKTQPEPALWSKSRWRLSASTSGASMWMPTSQRMPKSMRRLRMSRVWPNWRSLTRPPPLSVDSRLMKPFFCSCSQAAVTLKSKALSSSSADTTRVTSAPCARAPDAETARTTTICAANLWTAALKVRAQCNTRPQRRRFVTGRRCPKLRARRPWTRTGLLPHHRGLIAQAELLHLRLEALARDLELAGGLGDVAARLVEGALDELALDPLGLGAHGLLERARPAPRRPAPGGPTSSVTVGATA